MFNLGKKIKEKVKEVVVQMVQTDSEEAELIQGTFKGFIVKDGTESLQKRLESKTPILGSVESDTKVKFWITL